MYSIKNIYFLSLSLCLYLAGCTSLTVNEQLDASWTPLSTNQYRSLVQNNTKNHKAYRGIDLAYDISVTALTPELQSQELKQKAVYEYWSAEQAEAELEKSNSKLFSVSRFFLSFYTPNKPLPKLHIRGDGWVAKLLIGNQVYEGTINQAPLANQTYSRIYPVHGKWSQAYFVSFNLDPNLVFKSNYTLIISGPTASARFNF